MSGWTQEHMGRERMPAWAEDEYARVVVRFRLAERDGDSEGFDLETEVHSRANLEDHPDTVNSLVSGALAALTDYLGQQS